METNNIRIAMLQLAVLSFALSAFAQSFPSGGFQGRGYGNIIQAPQANVALQNITVSGSQDECYDATQVLTVAGGGTTFIVESGAIATMVAGEKIIYQYGTRAFSGGFMHGYITTEGQYCSLLKNQPVATAGPGDPPKETPEPPSDEVFFKVYPNPTTGNFTLEITGNRELSETEVVIYSLIGKKVLQQKVPGQRKYEFSLNEMPPGIYLLRVLTGMEAGMVKVIRQ